jgi:TolB-like protein/tRNA A-37 threonylcarbamoyl transferase component Bud32/Tfp pilus assembly protein PilF
VGDTRDPLETALSDRYLIERQLGRGGMATVYLARDLKHKRQVALKVLHPELAWTLGPARFRREIETAAHLQHPHICSVYDSGEDDGRLWFTMPYIRGESLRDRLRREGRLPLAEAVRITSEAARALEYAHREGVIHRDIKPENLLITTDGDTLVADFGIAHALGSPVQGSPDRLTETGVALGTAAYMAPEQATGGSGVDARADQYALAVTCYEMLAGRPPFGGPTAAAVIAERFRGPPPSVTALRPDVPEPVDAAIKRALALDPDQRFGSIGELARALTEGASVAGPANVPVVVAPPRRPRRLARVIAAVGVAALFVAGAFALGRQDGGRANPAAAHAAGPVRIAVMAFENLGDSADAYFADGVADEVRGKLTALPGFEVIARESSVQYRGKTAPARQIARELGVRYLLTGTVRWDKRGANRVRVSPELIDAGQGGAPTSRWQEPFDAPLTDVFQVQADIAGRVAEALGVALGDSTRRELAERPTTNLAAYDAFLKGEAASQDFLAPDPRALSSAIEDYEQAVALDSGFVAAWVELARARTNQYANYTPMAALETGALQAAERARALAPNRPEPYLALGEYYSLVRLDNERSLEAFRAGLRLAPDNVSLLTTTGRTDWRLGRWDDAVARFARASTLDPRSATNWRRYALMLLWMRRYDQASASLERGLALVPTSLDMLEVRAAIRLALGDTTGARAITRRPPAGVDATELAVWFARTTDLYWVLDDEAQRRVLALPPSAFAGDRLQWTTIRAQMYYARGNPHESRTWADSGLIELDKRLREAPEDAQGHVFRGLMLAYLGRKREATVEGEHALALAPISRDAFIGPYIQHQLVRIYIVLDERDKALDRLEPLLKIPYPLSPGWLRVDPNFAPLRGNPRFEALAAGQG